MRIWNGLAVCSLGGTLLAAAPAATAQQQPAVSDTMAAACVSAARAVSDPPGKIEYEGGKVQETTHGIIRSDYPKIIAVTVQVLAGTKHTNARCDFAQDKGRLVFVAGQYNGQTYLADDRDPKKERFRYAINDIIRQR